MIHFLIERNSSSMFLKAVGEENIDIANKCKNKTSTDCDEVDM